MQGGRVTRSYTRGGMCHILKGRAAINDRPLPLLIPEPGTGSPNRGECKKPNNPVTGEGLIIT